jgi:hypothetical protein
MTGRISLNKLLYYFYVTLFEWLYRYRYYKHFLLPNLVGTRSVESRIHWNIRFGVLRGTNMTTAAALGSADAHSQITGPVLMKMETAISQPSATMSCAMSELCTTVDTIIPLFTTLAQLESLDPSDLECLTDAGITLPRQPRPSKKAPKKAPTKGPKLDQLRTRCVSHSYHLPSSLCPVGNITQD